MSFGLFSRKMIHQIHKIKTMEKFHDVEQARRVFLKTNIHHKNDFDHFRRIFFLDNIKEKIEG